MIELVESTILAEQLKQTIVGKKIKDVIVGQSPHKFAFFTDDPEKYPSLLIGKEISETNSHGSFVEIVIEDRVLLLNDGISLKYHDKNEKRAVKHQLLIEFEDLSSISASVQMYGGILCYPKGEIDNSYYLVAKEKPSLLSDEFNRAYFTSILSMPGMEKLSAKAFLATEQRIPGIGNGVLQDILYYAKIHPKTKIKAFSEEDKDRLFSSIKTTLKDMIKAGGRDTEKDLFQQIGGYQTKMSKNTLGKECPVCKTIIQKEAYLGGSIYYCGGCQRV
ncbi:endonuclease VIII [Mobilitalea sibirica]|uniref:Endonuclease VIII n=1 Tax=Mobilitalea sibirica TaxID=1462919 RepID=A0A8J7H8I2_9FIRM|nr:endonuclease VIII [Mobilitalea sibirica]MBH1940280.1 endonuclease VIII [Mobilitalea sibirica]